MGQNTISRLADQSEKHVQGKQTLVIMEKNSETSDRSS